MWVQALRQAGRVPGQGKNHTPDAYTAAHYLVMPTDVCEVVSGVTTCKVFGG
jgi:hypothetical protein